MARVESNAQWPISYNTLHIEGKPHATSILMKSLSKKRPGFSYYCLSGVHAVLMSEVESIPQMRVLTAATSPYFAPLGDLSGVNFEQTGDFYKPEDQLRIKALFWDIQAERLKVISRYRIGDQNLVTYAQKAEEAIVNRDVLLAEAKKPLPTRDEIAGWTDRIVSDYFRSRRKGIFKLKF